MSAPTLIHKSQLQDIITWLNGGMSQVDIARELGVSQPAVSTFLKVNGVKFVGRWEVSK